MRFLVGKLSRLFGISPQTLHHYEKLGILEAFRDEANGYRYYDEYGLQRLGTIKRMRNAGFALKDSALAYGRTTEAELYREYKKRKREVVELIKEQQRIAERLDLHLDNLERLWIQEEGFRVSRLEGFRRFELDPGEEELGVPPGLEGLAARWVTNLFYTATSILIDFDGEDFLGYTRGFIVEESVFEELIGASSPNTLAIPAGDFASRVFLYRNRVDLGSMRDATVAFLRDSGRSLSGKPFTRHIDSFRDPEDNAVNVVELLLPLSPPRTGKA